MPSQLRLCGDCAVAPGQPHVNGCDVARCLRSGRQRLSCPAPWSGFRDCGRDVWTGEWPGEADCREQGLWCYWQAPAHGRRYGRWVPCTADHPNAVTDLNRLYEHCRWDAELGKWVRGSCVHDFVWHVVVDEGGPDRLRECVKCGMLDSEELLRAALASRLVHRDGMTFFGQ